MLFVFREPVRVSFYMKDTLIPLDIAFIGQGKVLQIESMVPCKVEQCPLTIPNATYEMALEVAAGDVRQGGDRSDRAGLDRGDVAEGELTAAWLTSQISVRRRRSFPGR